MNANQFPNRRSFLQHTAVAGAVGLATTSVPFASTLARGLTQDGQSADPLFKISLAQWSLHKSIFDGKVDHLDFAKIAKQEFGIEAIEYVNQFFKDKAGDEKYLAEMNKRAADNGVTQLLIMVDGEGALGDANLNERSKAVANHHKWVEAAKALGCHSIRVNASSSGNREDQVYRAADGLRALSEFAKPMGLNVIVENHGGLSSDGKWLSQVIEKVEMDNCGTLPDFGNFNLGNGNWYDRYEGVTELMKYAKAVSAKSHDFGDDGSETNTDYTKMMKIVLDAGYHGFVGIEYEGSKLGEFEGIKATKALLEATREKLASA